MTQYAFKSGVHQVHAIPAIHTTHKHIVRISQQDSTMRDTWNYAIGKTPPRYPVPSPIFLAYDWADNVAPANRYWQPNKDV